MSWTLLRRRETRPGQARQHYKSLCTPRYSAEASLDYTCRMARSPRTLGHHFSNRSRRHDARRRQPDILGQRQFAHRGLSHNTSAEYACRITTLDQPPMTI